MTPVQQAIVRAAAEEGVDPATALAYADRESAFNPNAHSSKTIHGLFQMRGDLRQKYGVGDSDDPYTQAKGGLRLLKDNRAEMSRVLGRNVTDEETYLGHHFGATRAARMLQADPSTPVDQAFSPEERSLNPHFDRAGTYGKLNSSILSDMSKRRQKFGGDVPDFSEFGEPVSPSGISGTADQGAGGGGQTSAPDLSTFGDLAGAAKGTENINTPAPAAPSAPDLSKFGSPA